MSTLKQHSLAAVIAVFISAVSFQAIITVPPAQAQVQAQSATAQIVELA